MLSVGEVSKCGTSAGVTRNVALPTVVNGSSNSAWYMGNMAETSK